MHHHQWPIISWSSAALRGSCEPATNAPMLSSAEKRARAPSNLNCTAGCRQCGRRSRCRARGRGPRLTGRVELRWKFQFRQAHPGPGSTGRKDRHILQWGGKRNHDRWLQRSLHMNLNKMACNCDFVKQGRRMWLRVTFRECVLPCKSMSTGIKPTFPLCTAKR